jgi:hypothetical protein
MGRYAPGQARRDMDKVYQSYYRHYYNGYCVPYYDGFSPAATVMI